MYEIDNENNCVRGTAKAGDIKKKGLIKASIENDKR